MDDYSISLYYIPSSAWQAGRSDYTFPTIRIRYAAKHMPKCFGRKWLCFIFL